MLDVVAKKLPGKPEHSTEFGLHVSHCTNALQRVIDLSERKLLILIRTCRDADRKLALLSLLADYKSGKVAIAWEKGNRPIYVVVTRG